MSSAGSISETCSCGATFSVATVWASDGERAVREWRENHRHVDAAHDREVAAEALTGFVKYVSERVEDYMSVATLKALAASYQDKETS